LGVVKIKLTEGKVVTAAAVKARGGEQVNGRERETDTLLSRHPLNLNLSVAVSRHVISAVRCFLLIPDVNCLTSYFLHFTVRSLGISAKQNLYYVY